METPEVLGTYIGETQDGVRHGFGKYVFQSGARYEGYWRKGLKHGVGVFIYPDGSRYEGQWWENRKHGYGRYTYPNGDTYDGTWCLDKRQGNGLYYDAEREFYYKGYFSDGELNGSALVLMNNVQFNGNFVDGKPTGPGTYFLPNGLLVRGEFRMIGDRTPLWKTSGVGRGYSATK